MKGRKLAQALQEAVQELDYAKKKHFHRPEDYSALKLGVEEEKWLYRYIAEAEFGIGHNNVDSLHNNSIEGYSTELTEHVSVKTGKPITRKQLTDQRIYQRDNDIMSQTNLVTYECELGEDSEEEGVSSSERFDLAMHIASESSQEESHIFMSRYGFGNGVHSLTPDIQVVFLNLIKGEIHRIGISKAKILLQVTYDKALLKEPTKESTLKAQLDTALSSLSNWYNLETKYLKSSQECDPTQEEELELQLLSPEDRVIKATQYFNEKRQARQQRLKSK